MACKTYSDLNLHAGVSRVRKELFKEKFVQKARERHLAEQVRKQQGVIMAFQTVCRGWVHRRWERQDVSDTTYGRCHGPLPYLARSPRLMCTVLLLPPRPSLQEVFATLASALDSNDVTAVERFLPKVKALGPKARHWQEVCTAVPART